MIPESVMGNGVYINLCHRLNEDPIGAPENDHFLAILKALFTPEEAELALFLKIIHESISEIAKNSRKDETQILPLLESMVQKGTVEKNYHHNTYRLFSTCPGIWETSFASGEKSPLTEFLAHEWREYYKSGWWKEMHRAKTPLTRIFPIGASVMGEREVLPYEKTAEIIKNSKVLTLMHCTCRTAAALDGADCGKPKETCLIFGEFGEYLVKTGKARDISVDEALAILKTTEEAGLVHLTLNTQETGDQALGICSCCKCCCTQLRATTQMGKPAAVAKSRFFPEVDEDACVSCGVCEERCPMGAISINDGPAQVALDRCIGCGVCASGCPVEAISLKEIKDFKEPSVKLEDLFVTFLQEKAENQ
jgi:Na+-translocating ferredoxin:NAD+ oxidoreductase subunit B